MMFLILNLIIEANYASYWENIKSNRIFHLILLFISFTLIGLIWTSNLDYAMHDFRVKLPLLVITTALASKPIQSKKQLHVILTAFITSTTIISLINFSMYQHWIGNQVYDDIRGMSLFSSHIRYALSVSFSCAILLYFIVEVKRYIVLALALILWLVFYTYYSQVITGYLTLFGVFFVYSVYKFWPLNRILISILSFGFVATSSVFLFWLLNPITINQSDYQDLPRQTIEGEYYIDLFDVVSPITHKPIYIQVCEPELRRDWSLYSKIDFDSTDLKGQPIKGTIIRYMSSLDYPKDAEHLAMLTEDDIKNIEKGYPSRINTGIMARLYGVKFQLNNETDPNNHSLLERLEYWKAGMNILSNNILIGVGTGDINDVFKTYYNQSNSLLTEENRNRTHNMYLTVFITLGIFGIVLFILIQAYFIRLNFKKRDVLALSFIVLILISFLIEDTLETQTGITFYALFLGLFSSKTPIKEFV